ncbi:MAG: hypothetical protein WA624_00400, partial [Methylocella sp.]
VYPTPLPHSTIGHFTRLIGVSWCIAISLVAIAVAQPNAQLAPAVARNSPAPSILRPPGPTSSDGIAVSVNVGSNHGSPERKCIKGGFELLGEVAWPLTVLILAVPLLLNRKLLRLLFGSLRRVKAGDLEFEFNAQDALRAKISISDAYEEFRKTAQVAYAHFVRVYSIRERFQNALMTLREKVKGSSKLGGDTLDWPEDFRATVHVPDVVLSEFTYQLLDYLPRGGGSGRRFSSRRGILGRSWRLERSLGMGNALVAPTSAPGAKPEEAALIQEWGMTRTEAFSWRQDQRHSFLCIIVRSPEIGASPGIPIGVLYVDSKTVNAFGTDDEAVGIAKWAETQPAIKELGEALNQALQDLRKGGTFLDFSR